MSMNDTDSFGTQLRQLRAAADLTQELLADALGCATETVRSFENGRRRPSREMAARLADVLHVAPDCRDQFIRSARAAGRPAGGPDQPAVSLTVPPAAAPPAPTQPEPPPLLGTKLYLPRPRETLVARPRLVRRLDGDQRRPITLVAASAGFGKTTLLASWLAERQQAQETPARGKPAGAAPPRAAWLALDSGDSDPTVFLRYLIAALQTIEPRVGAATLAALRGPQAPPIDALLPGLARDFVLLPEGSVLVLDDYHAVESAAVHQILGFLVEHLPPQLRLVIASRVDPPLPLGRLRARGQLAELRAADLRFTADEAAAFFAQALDTPVRPEDVATLEGRTEGWIAGLQLAALAMQHRDDLDGFVRAFAGSNRFVVDYLAEEVLDRLPAHLHAFVLQTSILGRLCGPLCDMVLGLDEEPQPAGAQSAYSQLLLAELERANLFLVPLDDERRWYRYHHLFGEVVRARLQQGTPPQRVAELHRRASLWHERAGLDAEAVHHAVAAADWDRAVRLLVFAVPRVVGRGQFHTGRAWLASLPEHVFRDRPQMAVYDAGVLMYLNQVDAAEARLATADAALAAGLPAGRSPEEARLFAGQAAVIKGAVRRIRGDLAGCIALSREALELLPDPETAPLKLRALAALNTSRAFLVSGDVSDAVEERAAAVVAPLRATGNLFALLTSLINLARLRAARGRLRQAAATYEEARALAAGPDELRTMVGGAAFYAGLGDLRREQGDLATAEELLGAGLALVQGGMTIDADVLAMVFIATARLRLAQGAVESAEQTLDRLLTVGRERSIAPHLLARARAELARLALLRGDLPAAVAWADGSCLDPAGELSYPREDEHLTLARVRIAQGLAAPAGPAHDSARLLLDRLLAGAAATSRAGSLVPILALRALLLRACGEHDAALVDIGRALALSAPEGYRRVFLDEGEPMARLLAEASAAGPTPGYAAELLAGFPAAMASVTGGGEAPEPERPGPALTEREHEVLRLLAAGRGNQAIAGELIVAVGTVKRHLNSIFSKLGVETRLAAVARARELGLL